MQSASQPQEETLWSVWRQDDNANVFRITGGLSKVEADQLVAEYEAKKHKQMYWAEKEKRAHPRD